MIFLILSLAAYLVQNYSNKIFAQKFGGRLAPIQNLLCVIGAALVLLVAGYARSMPSIAFLYAGIYGTVYFLTVYFLLRAMSDGPLGLCNIICNMGNFLSVLFGVFAYSDPFNAFTVVGSVMMILATVLSAPSSRRADGRRGFGWFIFAVGSALCNGVLGSFKIHVTKSLPDVASGTFLFWAFIFASVTGMIIIAIEILRGLPLKECTADLGRKALTGLGSGFGTALGNLFFYLALASKTSSAILIPLHCGSLSMLCFLMSWLVFKDTRLTKKNVAALIICILGVVFINIK